MIFGLALPLLTLVATGPAAAAADYEVAEYTIADATGDWGFPSPYAHYSRGPGYVRMSLLFDTLVWKDDGGYLPALAEDWEYIEDDNAYSFELEEDVTWNDGEPFDASDVVFTVEYIQDHPYQWVDSGIIDRAEATGDRSVKLYLSEPYAPFMDLVACTLPILPQHVWDGVSDPASFREDEALIGTGPFRLSDYNKAQGTYLYKARDDYYSGAPKVGRIVFRKMSDQTAPAALRQGSVDAASVPPEATIQLKDAGLKIIEGSHDWNAKLMINHQKEPFSDPEFRRALAYAIDRVSLVEVTQRGQALVGSPGMVPPDSDWYNPDVEQYEYDPDEARDIIEDLGREGEEVEILVAERGIVGWPGSRVAELVEEQLEDAGLEVTLRSLDGATLDTKVQEWDFDLALLGHGGLGADPDYLRRMTLDEVLNSARYYEDGELVDLLEEQQSEMDEDDRADMIFEAQELYAEDLPALTLYYPNWYWAHNGDLDLYYTRGGIAIGVPIPLNKMAFL
ncbi:ABC transporter substrate-binding protein [Methanocrinis sp.]|uniref:ABC transporter substrate-binding protein n=1 Tax=Methanocrinis sp. TaxID=3101522 RepID=UPI003D131E07